MIVHSSIKDNGTNILYVKGKEGSLDISVRAVKGPKTNLSG